MDGCHTLLRSLRPSSVASYPGGTSQVPPPPYPLCVSRSTVLLRPTSGFGESVSVRFEGSVHLHFQPHLSSGFVRPRCRDSRIYWSDRKQEQFSVPLWGWLLRRWGVVPLDRAKLKSAIRSLGKVEESVRAGRSLLISPEGTRSPDGRLLPFKKGPFHVASGTGAPLVPILIDGAHRSKPRSGWHLYPGTIRVRVESILPSAGTSPDELRTRAESMFRRSIESAK